MNFLDLFAGIGGNAYAAQQAGLTFNNHLFSEIEPFCIGVMQKHYPNAISLGSIKEIDGEKLKEQFGNDWFITGGFPCQDLSTAGKRKGITSDTRSGLWSYYATLIKTLKPKWCIIENVRGLFSLGFTRVLQDLHACGYDAEWQVVRACDVGRPHNRQRVWIVAYPSQTRCTGNTKPSTKTRRVANLFQPHGEIDAETIIAEWEREQTTGALCREPYVYRRNVGLSAELYKNYLARVGALGNSICPEIAQRIMERIKYLEA